MSHEIAKTQGELAFLKIKKTSENYIDDKVRTFTSMFPCMTFEEKRAVVKEILDSIIISDTEIQISLYSLPFFQKQISSIEKVSQIHRGSLLLRFNFIRNL